MGYKALLIDIDGTLVCPERKNPTKRSVDELKKLQSEGVLIVPATGRGFKAIRPEVLGGLVADYSICFNGACVLDRTGKAIFGQHMSGGQMAQLRRLAEENDYSMGFSFVDGYYTYYRDSLFREFYRHNNGDMECLADGTDHTRHLKDMPYSAFGLIPGEKAAVFNSENNGLIMLPFKENSYDICQTGINKATGAEWLLKFLGIGWKETVAIGDGANDRELLRAAGLGVAMGNAAISTKEAADYVTGDVHHDGAYDAIKKVFGPNGVTDVRYITPLPDSSQTG